MEHRDDGMDRPLTTPGVAVIRRYFEKDPRGVLMIEDTQNRQLHTVTMPEAKDGPHVLINGIWRALIAVIQSGPGRFVLTAESLDSLRAALAQRVENVVLEAYGARHPAPYEFLKSRPFARKLAVVLKDRFRTGYTTLMAEDTVALTYCDDLRELAQLARTSGFELLPIPHHRDTEITGSEVLMTLLHSIITHLNIPHYPFRYLQEAPPYGLLFQYHPNWKNLVFIKRAQFKKILEGNRTQGI